MGESEELKQSGGCSITSGGKPLKIPIEAIRRSNEKHEAFTEASQKHDAENNWTMNNEK